MNGTMTATRNTFETGQQWRMVNGPHVGLVGTVIRVRDNSATLKTSEGNYGLFPEGVGTTWQLMEKQEVPDVDLAN